jgi:Spy/CpxP family protein refolding chaperone
MITFVAIAVLALVLAPQPSSSQTQSPYIGFETRPIKSLSDQQVGDLRAGRGMGLALAAELNGYPGPAHVMELAGSLELTEGQRTRVEALLAAMKAEAVPLGEKLIMQEAELERRFAGRTITEPSLTSTVHAIGQTQATLRAAHLKYHLSISEILTPDQIKRYAELRGYSNGAHAGHQHGYHPP